MRRHIRLGIQLLNSQRGRYLVCGVFNVAVNYVLGAMIYKSLLPRLSFILVGVIVTIVSISFSFTTHKMFVFRTKGKWLIEYLRSYIIYGSSAVLNIGFMWLLLNWAHTNIWVAQALVTAVAVAISYVGNTAFTFRQTELRGAKTAVR